MAESVYKVIELVGTSTISWEKAAAAAVKVASLSLRELRVAEVSQLDLHIVEGKVVAYRAKVNLSFKYLSEGEAKAEAPAPKAAAAAPPAAPKVAAKRAAKKAPKPAPAPEAPAPAKKKAARRGKRKG